MDTPATLTAWLVVAAVLGLSGLGKFRDPAGAAEAFTALRVPAALSRPWTIRALPWGEIVLALLLLGLPHPGSVVAAALALGLLVAYLILVCRSLAAGDRVSCHCFGTLGSGTVDGWALVRNALLVLLAGLALIDAVRGSSVPARVADLGRADSGDWWWVLALVVVAALTFLIVRPGEAGQHREGSPASGARALTDISTQQPALRLPVPDVPVRLAEGAPPVSLRDLAAQQPQVLLLLSPGCGPCRMLSGRLAQWDREMPGVGFRVAHTSSFETVRESLPQWAPHFVQDTESALARALDDPARPWAIVLGTGGRFESAPAQGYLAIVTLVETLGHPGSRRQGTEPGEPHTQAGAH